VDSKERQQKKIMYYVSRNAFGELSSDGVNRRNATLFEQKLELCLLYAPLGFVYRDAKYEGPKWDIHRFGPSFFKHGTAKTN